MHLPYTISHAVLDSVSQKNRVIYAPRKYVSSTLFRCLYPKTHATEKGKKGKKKGKFLKLHMMFLLHIIIS